MMREPNMAEWADAARLHFITDSLPALVAYVDAQECYRYNNHAYLEWFGVAPEEIYGQPVREVIGEPAYEMIRPHIAAVLSGQQVVFETQLPYKDAGMRQILATYVPEFDETGQVRGFVALINDISEKKEAEEALRVSAEQLEEEREILETV